MRRLLPIVIMMLGLFRTAAAQEVYIASWTIQDLDHGLQGPLAVDIIERTNEWLTRDNPEAPTGRLDDRLQVTVVGEYNPHNGTIRERLFRLNIGGHLLEEDFGRFLDSAIISEILFRNYFWRDESLTVLDSSLSPSYYQNPRRAPRRNGPPTYEKVFALRNDAGRYSLSRISVPLTDRAHVWAGLGHEELGMPGLSYRRIRAGVASGGIRGWFEVPLPLTIDPVLTGTNQAAPGAGLSFELGRFGGGVTWSDPYAAASIDNDSGYVMNASALLYGIVPIEYMSWADGWLRVKLGAGYLQGTRVVEDTAGSLVPAESSDWPTVFIRGEYASLRTDGTPERSAALEIFGTGLVASYFQRLGDRFGVELGGTVQGIWSDRAPFLPASSLWVSPVVFLK